MLTLGVDPGADGCMVLLDGLTPLGSWPMPWVVGIGVDPAMLSAALDEMRAHGPYEAIVEASGYQVGAGAGGGARTAYRTGHTLGVLQGALAALRVPYRLVDPQTWQRGLGLHAARLGLAPMRPADDATEAQRRAYKAAMGARVKGARAAGQARQAAYVAARVPGLVLMPGKRRTVDTGIVAACCVALWGQG